MNELIEFLKKEGFLTEEADEGRITEQTEKYVETQVKERTGGLIQNRDKIKEEKMKLQEQFNNLKSQYSFVDDNEISIELFNDMKSELETLRSKGGSDAELEEKFKKKYEQGKKAKEDELAPKLTKFETDLNAMTESYNKANKRFYDYKAESEIRKAVSKTGIQYDPYWFDGLMNNAKIEVGETGDISISLPYEDQGHLPIEDWVKSFPSTEIAKRMTPAKKSSGGGAFGSSSSEEGNESLADMYNKFFK